MDEDLARAAFDRAITSYEPEFGVFFLARFLDLHIDYPDERCVIEFPVHDFLFNPQGSLHGGIIATVMDISMGHLLRHHYGQGGSTLQLNIQYVRALRKGTARCEASFVHRGRSIAFLQTKLYDAPLRIAASATSTWKVPMPAGERN
ncbi:PaaI family thioesterase [Microvirga zambiensis]|uniref:PaaI family thioesterase n=1 Tax=Microvirga zambiensis TaxID=1402137 RepID=UPI00191D413F|nr:PaaI family thioesterase [Microvirga zambiensis]